MENTRNKKILLVPLIIVIVLLIISLIFNIIQFNNNPVFKNDENVVFFGDSITEQYEIEKYYPKRNIVNSGISGEKTEDLIGRLEKDVYRYNPSKVFILVGINDICNHVEEEDILFNIQTIINGIKSNRKNTVVYVESIYPLNYKKMDEKKYNYCRDIDNTTIKKINKKIEKLCIESNINYIDVYSNMVDKEGKLKDLYTKEGLHINNLGYLKVTSILNDYFYDE